MPRSSSRRCPVVFPAGLAVILLATAAAHAAVTVTAATDKSQYRRGEAIDFSVTAHNSDSVPVGLTFGSSTQSMYFIDANYFYPQVGLTVITGRSIPANGSYTWTYRHQWTDFDIPLGSHDFHGLLEGYNALGRGPISSPTGTFAVVPNAPPPAALDIDFDHAPGSGGASVASATEYWPLGVRFKTHRSDGDRTAGIGSHDGNQYLTVGSTTYPPGFNLFADFDGTYHEVSAEVAAAVGVSVTMIARNAGGDVLGSVTSNPMSALYEFVPLSVSSPQPIARLEWWPSNQSSGLHVDNLVMHAPEPGGVAAAIGLATLALTTRRKFTA